MPPGSWQPTSWSLWSAAPSPQCPRKWIVKLWEPELRQQGRGITSVHTSWWHLTGEGRGPVPPADLLEQKGKNPQIEVLASLTTAASPARTDYKKPLKKPVTVGSYSSCVLLMELKWIYILLLLHHELPEAHMGSMYLLVWGAEKWSCSAGLKHGLLLKYISAETASRTFLVVFCFLFMALSWNMITNFPYFWSLHCFDRFLSFKSWNRWIILMSAYPLWLE